MRSWSLARVACAAALMLAVAGCSRLSGDHDADASAEEAARLERLLDDKPESLTTKREKKPANRTTNPEPAVVSDVPQSIARPTPSLPVQAAPVQTPVRSTADRRPSSARRTKKAARAVNKADEIPDAAEIGL